MRQVTTPRYVRCHTRPIADGTACFATPGHAYRLIASFSDATTGPWHRIVADDGQPRNYRAKYFGDVFSCIDGERAGGPIG